MVQHTMGKFICANSKCNKEFPNKHSTSKYCGRRCAAVGCSDASKGIPKTRVYTDDELISLLKAKALELGKTPGGRCFDADKSLPSVFTYQARFGCWRNACTLAGVKPNKVHPKTMFGTKSRALPATLRFEVLKRDGFRCVYCGGTPDQGYTLEVDHRFPYSKDDTHNEDNLVTSCWLCNSGKGATELV